MRYSCVVFEFDGTLVDTTASMTVSLNEVLAVHGRRAIDANQVRRLAPEGMRTVLRRSFIMTGTALNDIALGNTLETFRKAYRARLLELTRPSPDLLPTLRRLRAHDVTLAVLTNRHEATTVRIMEHFGVTALVDYLVAGDMGVARKPDPAGLLQIMASAEVDPGHTLLVGNARSDLLTARNGSVSYATCSPFAERNQLMAQGADFVLHRLDQLVNLVIGDNTTTPVGPPAI